MTRERVLGISFKDAVDIARDIETVRRQERDGREAKRPQGSGSFSGALLRGQFQQGRGRSFMPAQSSRPEYRGGSSGRGYQGSQQSQPSPSALLAQSLSRALSAQGSSRPSASASYSGTRGSLQSQFPAPRSFYACGEFGHMRRECPRRAASSSQQR
uniref:DNA-binding protein HEXBP-like n=2 Tax=Nicotiana sylvestris TaxID=4096 RepID=A0A1U7VHC0_NICSY